MPSVDVHAFMFPDDDTLYNLRDTRVDNLPQTASETSYENGTSGLAATNVQGAIDEVVSDIKGTTESLAQFHLGFYLDENGGLCQVNEL